MSLQTKTMADVSVIIPAYRASETIERALDSIAGQTLLPREIIVVDDGSDDGTFDVAASYRHKLEGVELRLFQQSNRGAGKARNKAIEESRCKYLAFLDADDEWLPEKIEKSMQHIEIGNLVLVAHNSWIMDGDNQTLNDCAKRFREGPDPFVSLYKKGFIDTCTVVVHRDAVMQVGGFDERLRNAQDFELWLALCADPETKFEVFDDVLSRYYLIPGSIMSHTERRLACCLDIAKRYGPELKRRPGFGLFFLWYRILAVHYEAFRGSVKKRHITVAVILPVKTFMQLIFLSISYLRINTLVRPRAL